VRETGDGIAGDRRRRHPTTCRCARVRVARWGHRYAGWRAWHALSGETEPDTGWAVNPLPGRARALPHHALRALPCGGAV